MPAINEFNELFSYTFNGRVSTLAPFVVKVLPRTLFLCTYNVEVRSNFLNFIFLHKTCFHFHNYPYRYPVSLFPLFHPRIFLLISPSMALSPPTAIFPSITLFFQPISISRIDAPMSLPRPLLIIYLIEMNILNQRAI